MKKLLSFDLDGTLAESKLPISQEMAEMLAKLSHKYLLAVISGGDYPQFQSNVIAMLPEHTNFTNMYLLPTSGGKIYHFKNGEWQKIFSAEFTPEQKARIFNAINESQVLEEYKAPQLFGEIVEDRGAQITLSMLGQTAPVDIKKAWDPDKSKRMDIQQKLSKLLPDLNVKHGGSTSIDISKPGIDKGFAMTELLKILNLPKDQALFFGDALEENGNDYPVKALGVECIEVSGPEETLEKLTTI